MTTLWGGYHAVSAFTDANGNTTSLAYDREGQLLTITNPRGPYTLRLRSSARHRGVTFDGAASAIARRHGARRQAGTRRRGAWNAIARIKGRGHEFRTESARVRVHAARAVRRPLRGSLHVERDRRNVGARSTVEDEPTSSNDLRCREPRVARDDAGPRRGGDPRRHEPAPKHAPRRGCPGSRLRPGRQRGRGSAAVRWRAALELGRGTTTRRAHGAQPLCAAAPGRPRRAPVDWRPAARRSCQRGLHLRLPQRGRLAGRHARGLYALDYAVAAAASPSPTTDRAALRSMPPATYRARRRPRAYDLGNRLLERSHRYVYDAAAGSCSETTPRMAASQ